MAKAADALRVNPSDETIRVGHLLIRYLLTGADSGGTVAAFELTVPGSQRLPVPAHSHKEYEETIYGIEGTLVWTVEGRASEVAPGQMLCIPRGAVHRFDNHTAGDAKALCVITPGILSPAYFRESALVLEAAAGGPPDRAKITEIMLRHGLTPAAPPA
jgi:quercetin dioxygenase-like cupin family protein